jgi:hypothetical protein
MTPAPVKLEGGQRRRHWWDRLWRWLAQKEKR